ncbi:MAG: hypothetical protein LVR00_01890 [Rhabdochlamydiaceae bacterium]|jgi:hypothetical protein
MEFSRSSTLAPLVGSDSLHQDNVVPKLNAHAFTPIERIAQVATGGPGLMSAAYATSAVHSFSAALNPTQDGSTMKTVRVASSVLSGIRSLACAGAEPLNLAALITGASVEANSPSLVGRVSYGFKSLAYQLQNVVVVLFMTVTGYKIYENAKWALLSKDALHKKMQFSTVEAVSKKYSDKAELKKLAYDYFKDKIRDFLKRAEKEYSIKGKLSSDNLDEKLDDEINKLLTEGNTELIKNAEIWAECKGKTEDLVEAFGLYVRVMLERQSLHREIERVFGKEGATLVNKMRNTQSPTDALYKQVMSICRQRLVLDTLNFILGTAVMSLIALSVSTTLAFPLLMHISEGSPSFQYVCFVLKALVLGSIIFTPHGLVALTIFNLGMLINTIAKGGISKLPFMDSKELENCTRLDKALIHLNVILVLFSICSIGWMGSYGGLPSSTTAAITSAQLPSLGFHIFAISQIWNSRVKISRLEQQLLSEENLLKRSDSSPFIKSLLDKYGYDLFKEAFNKPEVRKHLHKQFVEKFVTPDEDHIFRGVSEEGSISILLEKIKEWNDEIKEDARASFMKSYNRLVKEGFIKSVVVSSSDYPDYAKISYNELNMEEDPMVEDYERVPSEEFFQYDRMAKDADKVVGQKQPQEGNVLTSFYFQTYKEDEEDIYGREGN